MKRLLLLGAAAVIAAAPAVTGLVGNASFAQSVPVHVPAGARTIDDLGRTHAEPGDDRGRTQSPVTTAASTQSPVTTAASTQRPGTTAASTQSPATTAASTQSPATTAASTGRAR